MLLSCISCFLGFSWAVITFQGSFPLLSTVYSTATKQLVRYHGDQLQIFGWKSVCHVDKLYRGDRERVVMWNYVLGQLDFRAVQTFPVYHIYHFANIWQDHSKLQQTVAGPYPHTDSIGHSKFLLTQDASIFLAQEESVPWLSFMIFPVHPDDLGRRIFTAGKLVFGDTVGFRWSTIVYANLWVQSKVSWR